MQRQAMRILSAMAVDIEGRIRARSLHLAGNPGDESVWWQDERWTREWTRALGGLATLAVEAADERARELLGPPPEAAGKALSDRVMRRLLQSAGLRITGLNQTTRDGVLRAVRDAAADGMRLGESMAQIGDRIEAIRVRDLPVFGEYRGELIARTETMRLHNEANIETYRTYGVGQVTADDGDFDVACSNRNGKVMTLDEALAIEEHPNGTLDWVPLVDQRVTGAPGSAALAPGASPDLPNGAQVPTLDRYAASMGMSKREFSKWYADDAAKTAAEARMNGFLAAADPNIAISEESLAKVLADGRFKSQFETRTSGGVLDTGLRATREDQLFGLGSGLDPAQRPIYGFFAKTGSVSGGSHDVAQSYGKVIVKLNRSVLQRTTFTQMDSLSRHSIPSRFGQARWWSGRETEKFSDVQEWGSHWGYVEAQYHGGVAVRDIDALYVKAGREAGVEQAILSAGFTHRSLSGGYLRYARPLAQ